MAHDTDGESVPTVLVVDDEDEVRDLLCRMVEMFGYHAKAMRTGEEAIQRMRKPEVSVDLVILDINLPGISGIDTAEQLRLLRPALPLLLISGLQSQSLLSRFQSESENRLTDFLAKPFDLTALEDKVRALLSQSGSAGTTQTRSL